jgi:hypothetical protein
MGNRLGTIFHETFSLSRAALIQILKTIENAPNISDLKQTEREFLFQQQTSLGTRFIKAMPRYALGCGLINSRYVITTFGRYSYLHDNLLDQVGTQWLMHYHLSAPDGPGAPFWNEIVSKQFYPGNTFSADDLVDLIGNYIWQTENRIISKKAVRSTATIFLGTYTKIEGLGKIHLLEMTESGRYRVRDPLPPPAWAIGYALLDFWEANYPGRIAVGLDIIQDSGFASLFMMGKSDLNEIFNFLQEARYLDIHKAAPPYQVVLLKKDQEYLLQQLYGAN